MMLDWIPLKFENMPDDYGRYRWIPDERLKDHYFYLVAHKAFATPMKAKYHDDICPYFEILSYNHKSLENWHVYDNVYVWDDAITHWMDIPEMPYNPNVEYGDGKYWEDK